MDGKDMTGKQKKYTLFGVTFTIIAGVIWFQFQKRNNLPVELIGPEQWGSYALGVKSVQDLKGQGLELENSAFLKGVKDALSGTIQDRGEKLSRNQLSQYESKFRELMAKNMAEIGKKNEILAQEFMNQNKSRSGVISLPSGLQYQILEPGQGSSPKLTDWVQVYYEVRGLDGELIEASSAANNKSIEMPVKMGLKALELGLQMMKPGGRYRFFVPPELGYGNFARPGIPANSVLIFEVKLFGVRS